MTYKINHGWLHGLVKPHFDSKGYKLLKDDMQFIEKCLSKIPTEAHRDVMVNYFSIWDAKVPEENSAESRPVNPRYEANTYLRSCCE